MLRGREFFSILSRTCLFSIIILSLIVMNVGYLFAVAAAIADGSFGVPFKVDTVALSGVTSEVFFFYSCVVKFIICFLCLLLLPYNEYYCPGSGSTFDLSIYGIVSGFFVSGCVWLNFVAFEIIGVALATGIFYGSSLLASGLYSVLILQQYNSLALYSSGMIVLMIGTSGMCGLEYLLELFEGNQKHSALSEDNGETRPLIDKQEHSMSQQKLYLGYVASILCGLLGGLGLAPYYYVDDSQKGFNFVASIAVGVIISAPIILLGKAWYNKEWPDMMLNKPNVLWWAAFSGFMLAINVICCIGALSTLYYGVALPLVCCGIIVGGLWGICVFDEMEDRVGIALFFVLACIILLGAVLISI